MSRKANPNDTTFLLSWWHDGDGLYTTVHGPFASAEEANAFTSVRQRLFYPPDGGWAGVEVINRETASGYCPTDKENDEDY